MPTEPDSKGVPSPFPRGGGAFTCGAEAGQNKTRNGYTMKKYIHYKTSDWNLLQLEVPNADGANDGHALGLEIDSNCFNVVFNLIKNSQTPDAVVIDTRDSFVTNVNLEGFRDKFIEYVNLLDFFRYEGYSIRTVFYNHVTYYSRFFNVQPEKVGSCVKYVHYKEPNVPDLLLSDNLDESKRGYTFGLEIQCDDFTEVLESIRIAPGVSLEFDDEDKVHVTNVTPTSFKLEFMRCMNALEKFSEKGYCIKEVRGKFTVWNTKSIQPDTRY